MITNEFVTIYKIEQNVEKQKNAGGTYKATVLLYQAEGGAPVEKSIHQGIVDKNVALKSALSSLKVGDTATITLEKPEGSKFTNVVGIHKGHITDVKQQVISFAPKTPAVANNTTVHTPSSSSGYDTTGIQVGNALNNACLLIAHKVVKGTPEIVAEDILRLAEKLKHNLKNGMYAYNPQNSFQSVPATKRETLEEPLIEDDDIPWN